MKLIKPDSDNWIDSVGYRKFVLASSSELHATGTKVQIVTISEGDTIPAHYHRESYEFYYVLRGECMLTCDNYQVKLKEDSMLLLKPGEVHSLSNTGSEPFELLVFKTNATDADTYWQDDA